MMLFVKNEYVCDVDVEMRRAAKVFESIEDTQGDFSYAFDVPNIAEIRKKLGIQSIDGQKAVYNKLQSNLRNASGVIYSGWLQVQRVAEAIECSFFSGNNDWFDLLSGTMQDIFDARPIPYTGGEVQDSWNNTEGIYFPVMDPGTLELRRSFVFGAEDHHPFYYAHSVIATMLSQKGLKLTGDLVNDWRYKRLIVGTGFSQEKALAENKCSIGKEVQGPIQDSDGIVLLTFQTDTTPFFNSGSFDTVNSKFVAPLNMTVTINIGIEADCPQGAVPLAVYVIKNSEAFVAENAFILHYNQTESTKSFSKSMLLNAGDEIEIFGDVLSNPIGAQLSITGGFFNVTPTFIYSLTIPEIMPRWTKTQFMANIFKMFNCIVSYESNSRTITANFFEAIKSKDPIDLSEFVDAIEWDLTEFVSFYGKKTSLRWADSDTNEDYNKENILPYGAHEFTVDNDFIEEEVTAVEMEAVAPGFKFIDIYGGFVITAPLTDVQETMTIPITSVSDSAGQALLNVPTTNGIEASTYIRVEMDGYAGDWFVNNVTATQVECTGMGFTGTATGELKVLVFSKRPTEDVYFALAVPNVPVSDFGNPDIAFNRGYAYFNLLRTGKPIDDHKLSLSFGNINDPRDFQLKMKEYFRLFERILNDPVKGIFTMLIPYHIFLQMDSQRPARIKTGETSNLYYISQTGGYKSSDQRCEGELIKL